jgi:GWxTD domain-containing protein
MIGGFVLMAAMPARSRQPSAGATSQWSTSQRSGTGPLSRAYLRLPKAYQKWVDEDVRWIITPEERAQFLRLHSDVDRDHFIEQFWVKRDPTPDTPVNEFKQEHYRRVAYANEHFGEKIMGCETDRGMIYIIYGSPTEMKTLPISTLHPHPTQIWSYHSLQPEEQSEFQFVDRCDCREFALVPIQLL